MWSKERISKEDFLSHNKASTYIPQFFSEPTPHRQIPTSDLFDDSLRILSIKETLAQFSNKFKLALAPAAMLGSPLQIRYVESLEATLRTG